MDNKYTDNRWSCEANNKYNVSSVSNDQISDSLFKPNETVSYVKSQRGKDIAVYHGFRYYLHTYKKDDVKCWYCEKAHTDLKCRAKVC